MLDDTPIEVTRTNEPTGPGFVEVPTTIVLDNRLSRGARLAYVILIGHSDNNHVTHLSQADLAAKLGVSRQHCSTHLHELAGAGLITIVDRHAADGKRMASDYIIHHTADTKA